MIFGKKFKISNPQYSKSLENITFFGNFSKIIAIQYFLPVIFFLTNFLIFGTNLHVHNNLEYDIKYTEIGSKSVNVNVFHYSLQCITNALLKPFTIPDRL